MSVHEYVFVVKDGTDEETKEKLLANANTAINGYRKELEDFSLDVFELGDEENPVSESALEALRERDMVALVKRGPGWVREPWMEASLEIPKLRLQLRYLKTGNTQLKRYNEENRERIKKLEKAQENEEPKEAQDAVEDLSVDLAESLEENRRLNNHIEKLESSLGEHSPSLETQIMETRFEAQRRSIILLRGIIVEALIGQQ